MIEPDNTLRVVGRHSVTLVDGSHMTSDIFQVKRYGEITISDARLHVLGTGRQFDMDERKLLQD